MECFIPWVLVGLLFVWWREARKEADHYRNSYLRVFTQWSQSLRKEP